MKDVIERKKASQGRVNRAAPESGPNAPEVARWLVGARAGDDDAAYQLFGYIRPTVARIVCSRFSRQKHQEDLIQEVFIKVFRNLDRYAERVPLERWVARIAVNTCTDAYRRSKNRPEFGMADFGEKEAATLEAIATDSADTSLPSKAVATMDIIEKLLDTLGPDDRRIVEMICLSGYSYRETSEATGWNISRIKVRLFRARQRLKTYLDELVLISPADQVRSGTNVGCLAAAA